MARARGGGAMRTALRLASAAMKARNRIRNKYNRVSRTTNSAPVTSQHEYKTLYRKKRMPYRKRKQWVSFVKKSTAVQMKNIALQTFVISQNMNLPSPVNATRTLSMTINSINGNIGSSGSYAPPTTFTPGIGITNDIARIIQAENSREGFLNPNNDQLTIMVESVTMDIAIRNVAGTTGTLLELYYFVARKDLEDDEAGYTSPEEYYIRSFNADNKETVGTTVNDTTLGITPFNASYFCKFFKITKKVRIQLQSGESTHLQIRDARNYIVSGAKIRHNMGEKYRLKGILIQGTGQPATSVFTTEQNCSVTVTKVYNYRIIKDNRVRAGS